jgi:hypothetical protein
VFLAVNNKQKTNYAKGCGPYTYLYTSYNCAAVLVLLGVGGVLGRGGGLGGVGDEGLWGRVGDEGGPS